MEDPRAADGSLKVAIAMLVGITFESSLAAGLTAAQIAIDVALLAHQLRQGSLFFRQSRDEGRNTVLRLIAGGKQRSDRWARP